MEFAEEFIYLFWVVVAATVAAVTEEYKGDVVGYKRGSSDGCPEDRIFIKHVPFGKG